MSPIRTLTKLKIRLLEDDKPQYQVAAICGMHPTTLSQYALDQKQISVVHLRALCKYFKCRQQDILGVENIEWDPPDE